MKNKKAIILLLVLFIIAILVTIYPMVSNAMFEKTSSKVQADYFETIENLDTSTIDEARKAAEEYNSLLSKGVNQNELESNPLQYEQLLNLNGNGVMCYIEIPVISVNLPVAHGTDADTLEDYVGHILGSSLPIGGESTHAILSGHSGMAGKSMFTDLHSLKAGDMVYIHVLNETLSYRVDEIETVLPDNTSGLGIEQGEDKLCLITCTPVGINSHRLLVHCSRTTDDSEQISDGVAESISQETSIKSTWQQQYIKGIVYGLLALLLGFAVYAMIKTGRKLYGKRH